MEDFLGYVTPSKGIIKYKKEHKEKKRNYRNIKRKFENVYQYPFLKIIFRLYVPPPPTLQGKIRISRSVFNVSNFAKIMHYLLFLKMLYYSIRFFLYSSFIHMLPLTNSLQTMRGHFFNHVILDFAYNAKENICKINYFNQ